MQLFLFALIPNFPPWAAEFNKYQKNQFNEGMESVYLKSNVHCKLSVPKKGQELMFIISILNSQKILLYELHIKKKSVKSFNICPDG